MTLPTGRPNADRTSCRAFTLIELILVMALVVIVMALISPSLSRFFRGRNLDSEARRMVSLTRHAQGRAASEGAPMRLWVDAQRRTYGVNAEFGGSMQDPHRMRFELQKDLDIQIFTDQKSGQTIRNGGGTADDGSSMAVGILFLPDGSIDESSPSRILIRETDERRARLASRDPRADEVWITTDPYRVKYEIATNIQDIARR